MGGTRHRLPPPGLALVLADAGLSTGTVLGGFAWTRAERVSVERENLLAVPGSGPTCRVKDPTLRAVVAFASLWLSPNFEVDVAQFARTWGLLDLCRHGLPATHRPYRLPMQGWDPVNGSRKRRGRDAGGGPCAAVDRLTGNRTRLQRVLIEPLERWRSYSRQAYSLIRVIQDVSSGGVVRKGSWDAWEDLTPLYPDGMLGGGPIGPYLDPQPYTKGEGLDAMLVTRSPFDDDEAAVAFAINRWLELGDVKVRLVVEGAEPRLVLQGSSLFGALAAGIALIRAQPRLAKVCDHCGQPYEPKAREHLTTRCCGKEECRKARGRLRVQRHRAGQADSRGPYKKGPGQ